MKTPEKVISTILKSFRDQLGADYTPYHNHAQRVYYYAKILLLMSENRKLAIAAAFHDLDIWVGDTMDYLKGSATLAKSYLSANQIDYLPDELAFIISRHHQLRKIKGNIEAEAFRKADLIDLSSGWVRYNIPSSLITEAERKFPRKGFTGIMIKKTINHAFRHPLNPIPMIRW